MAGEVVSWSDSNCLWEQQPVKLGVKKKPGRMSNFTLESMSCTSRAGGTLGGGGERSEGGDGRAGWLEAGVQLNISPLPPLLSLSQRGEWAAVYTEGICGRIRVDQSWIRAISSSWHSIGPTVLLRVIWTGRVSHFNWTQEEFKIDFWLVAIRRTAGCISFD